MPPRPDEYDANLRMGDNEGCIFAGETGKITCCCYGGSPRIIPESKRKEYKDSEKGKAAPRIPRSSGHHAEWIAACKGGPKAGSHFEHAAVLTEFVQLGNVAIRYSATIKENGRPVKLLWDAQAGKITNIPEANQFLQMEYRKGWEI
ncbi:MAG: hypothetical protein NTX50_19835 [Candidatus Sumerlaeota bacterium]|nr:hypothetical protein [Candidatus Sumerlaeota bacterium]